MSREKILIVDDEREMCFLIKSFLDNENYEIEIRNDAESALQDIDAIRPDLILLDVMLPEMNGIDLCLKIRNSVDCPILFMSCKSENIDKIVALSAGGDDYITKPFNSGELIARINAHLRRERRHYEKYKEDLDVMAYECNGLILNESNRTVTLDNESVLLTSKEFDILNLFMKKPKRVYSKEQIYESVWQDGVMAMSDTKTVQVHISSLRKKIEPDGRMIKYIYNIRGMGYKFSEDVKIVND